MLTRDPLASSSLETEGAQRYLPGTSLTRVSLFQAILTQQGNGSGAWLSRSFSLNESQSQATRKVHAVVLLTFTLNRVNTSNWQIKSTAIKYKLFCKEWAMFKTHMVLEVGITHVENDLPELVNKHTCVRCRYRNCFTDTWGNVWQCSSALAWHARGPEFKSPAPENRDKQNPKKFTRNNSLYIAHTGKRLKMYRTLLSNSSEYTRTTSNQEHI